MNRMSDAGKKNDSPIAHNPRRSMIVSARSKKRDFIHRLTSGISRKNRASRIKPRKGDEEDRPSGQPDDVGVTSPLVIEVLQKLIIKTSSDNG